MWCAVLCCACCGRLQVRSWPEFSNKLTVLDGHAKHGGRDGGVLAMAVTREEDNKPLKPVTRCGHNVGQTGRKVANTAAPCLVPWAGS